MDNTGAKISSHIDAHRAASRPAESSDTAARRRGGRPRPMRAPPATASCTDASARTASRSLIIGPTSVAGSCGSPTFSARDRLHQARCERVDSTSLVHEQPLRRRAHLAGAPESRTPTQRVAARAGPRPRRRSSARCCPARARPDADQRARGSTGRRGAAGEREEADVRVLDEPRPELRAGSVDEIDVPGRTPASSSSSNSRVALSGVSVRRLRSTTVLPDASAGATLCATMLSGELNDVMPQTTPRGTRIVNAIRCAWPGAASIGTISPVSRFASSADDDERLNRAPDLVVGVGDRHARLRR